MPVEINISDEGTKYLNTPARDQLRVAVESYSGDLLKEASRLEATAKTTAGNPEITSSMVRDADLLLRRAYRRPKKKSLVIVQIVAAVTGFLTGLLTDLALKDPGWMIAFVVVLSVALTTTIFLVLKD